jgi:hypothetical protein
MGTGRSLNPGVKKLGHEAEHAPPFSAKVNVWSYASAPPYICMERRIVKYELKLHSFWTLALHGHQ